MHQGGFRSTLVTKGPNVWMGVELEKPESGELDAARGLLRVKMTFWVDDNRIPAMHGSPKSDDGYGISPGKLKDAEMNFNAAISTKQKWLDDRKKEYRDKRAKLDSMKAPEKKKDGWKKKDKALEDQKREQHWGKATDWISKATASRDYAIRVRKMAEQIKKNGTIRVRIYAVYPGYEVDLVKFTAIPQRQ